MKTNVVAAFALGTTFAVAITDGAIACQGPSVVYSDDFKTADPAWGDDDGLAIGGGKLTLTAKSNTYFALENQAGFFEDVDICIDLVQSTDDPANTDGGILFWGADYANYYLFLVSNTGSAKVVRRQNNRWITPVGWTASDAIKTKKTDANSLRVVTKGSQATLYVNGKQFTQMRGLPPSGGGLIGVFGEAGPKAPVDFDFTNFKITGAP